MKYFCCDQKTENSVIHFLKAKGFLRYCNLAISITNFNLGPSNKILGVSNLRTQPRTLGPSDLVLRKELLF